VGAAASDDRDRLRGLAVAIFEELGPDDPRTVSYRRRLATAIY
jgi:thioredoxin-like negative regulator of GroEL